MNIFLSHFSSYIDTWVIQLFPTWLKHWRRKTWGNSWSLKIFKSFCQHLDFAFIIRQCWFRCIGTRPNIVYTTYFRIKAPYLVQSFFLGVFEIAICEITLDNNHIFGKQIPKAMYGQWTKGGLSIYGHVQLKR